MQISWYHTVKLSAFSTSLNLALYPLNTAEYSVFSEELQQAHAGKAGLGCLASWIFFHDF